MVLRDICFIELATFVVVPLALPFYPPLTNLILFIFYHVQVNVPILKSWYYWFSLNFNFLFFASGFGLPLLYFILYVSWRGHGVVHLICVQFQLCGIRKTCYYSQHFYGNYSGRFSVVKFLVHTGLAMGSLSSWYCTAENRHQILV